MTEIILKEGYNDVQKPPYNALDVLGVFFTGRPLRTGCRGRF